MSHASVESHNTENSSPAVKAVAETPENTSDAVETVMHFRVDISVRASSSPCGSSRSSVHEKESSASIPSQSKLQALADSLSVCEAHSHQDNMDDGEDDESLLSDVESEAPETLVAFQEVLQSLLEQHQQDRKRKKSTLSDITSSSVSSKPTVSASEARVPGTQTDETRRISFSAPAEASVPSTSSKTASASASTSSEKATIPSAKEAHQPVTTEQSAPNSAPAAQQQLQQSQQKQDTSNRASSSSGIQGEIRQRFEQRAPNPNVVALRVARSHEIEGILTQRRVSAISDSFRQQLEVIVRDTPTHFQAFTSQTGSNIRPSTQPVEARSSTAGIQVGPSPIVQASTYERVGPQQMNQPQLQPQLQPQSRAPQALAQRQARPQVAQQQPARNSGPAVVQGTMRNVGIARELGDVTQYHTVSTMLSGEFRQRLERLIRRRLMEAGVAPSARVIRRNVPANPNPNAALARNAPIVADFGFDGFEAAVGAGHGRGGDIQSIVSREVEIVRQEVLELRRMLSASLEMQMEMQRTLRQEISATLYSQRQAPVTASFNSQQPGPHKTDTCLICCEKTVDCAFYKCGHMCSCHTCALNMQQRNQPCPVCRAPIREVLRVYHTS